MAGARARRTLDPTMRAALLVEIPTGFTEMLGARGPIWRSTWRLTPRARFFSPTSARLPRRGFLSGERAGTRTVPARAEQRLG